MKTTIDEQLRHLLHPSVSELDYNYMKLEIYWELTQNFAKCLPEKWSADGVKILERSECFKEWVMKLININNLSLITLFNTPDFPKQNLHQWYKWQCYYIKDAGYYPPKIVLQAAVNEWLHRVSQVATAS